MDRQFCLSSTLQLGDDTLADDGPEIFFFRSLIALALALGALLGLLGRALTLLLLSLTLDE